MRAPIKLRGQRNRRWNKKEGDQSGETTKSMTQAQSKHLEKYETEVNAAFVKLDESFDEIKKSVGEKGWGENVPQYIHAAHAAARVKKQEFDAKVEIIKESQACEWKVLQSDVTELKDEAKDLLRRTVLQTQEAQSLGAAEASKKKKVAGKAKAKCKRGQP